MVQFNWKLSRSRQPAPRALVCLLILTPLGAAAIIAVMVAAIILRLWFAAFSALVFQHRFARQTNLARRVNVDHFH